MRAGKSTKNIDMTKGEPIRLVIRFSIPLIMGNILQQVYSMVDAAIVGNFVGVDALAAVGCTSWVVWLLLAICRDSSSAFCIVASQRIGAKNLSGFKVVVANAMIVGALLSILLTTALTLSVDNILKIMSVPENIFSDAGAYLFVYSCSAPFVLIYSMAGAMLRAAGNSRITMVAMMASSITNVALDLLFVVIFKWGVAGAAFATFLAQICSAGIALAGIYGNEPYHTWPEHRKPDKVICGEVIKLCLPMFWSSVIISVGGILVQKSINGMGSGFTAGIATGGKIFGLLEAIIMAIQAGTCIFVGQNLGAREILRIQKGVRRIVAMSVLLTACMTLTVWGLCGPLVSLFLSKEAEDAYVAAFTTGCQFTRVITVGMLIMTPMYLYRGVIQTMGHANYPMIAGCFQLLARLLTIWVLPLYLGKYAYYFTDIAAWLVTLPIVVIPYVYYIRRLEERGS